MARDRHGRSARGDSDERRRPPAGFRVAGARRFEALVDEAVALLPERLARAARDAQVAVDDVPAPEHVLDEHGDVTLARFEPGSGRDRPPRIVVHRRPAEQRASDRDDLVDLLRLAVGQALGRALGLDDDDLDDLWDDD